MLAVIIKNMRYLFIIFIFLSINLKSQSNKYKLQGCENPKGKEMKNICNSSLNQLIIIVKNI